MKKILKKTLKKYNLIDIIIYGSFVKNKDYPKDLDLAVLVDEKKPELNSLIKQELSIEKTHIEIISVKELYPSSLLISLITEGFSIKEDKYFKDILGIKPMKLYSYELKTLNRSQKTLFSKALNSFLKKSNGIKIGYCTLMVPVNFSGYFEEFLEAWNLRYKVKQWLVI